MESLISVLATFFVSRLKQRHELPHNLFNAIIKRITLAACEAVVLRLNKNGLVEVLMVRRPISEPDYPGLLHCPGSTFRKDENDSDVFKRLADKEFSISINNYNFIAPVFSTHQPGGRSIVCLVYLVTLKTEPSEGWYPVNNLPNDTVEVHRKEIIPIAVNAFLKKSQL